MACPAGGEKIIHGLRQCVQDHWNEEEFVVCKVDLKNAFNMLSCQALLDECATNFPELFPWVFWYYGQHPQLWHPLGKISSELGVQQGDPLGPLLFALVLHKLVRSIAKDKQCFPILFNTWYLDDGALAGPKSAIARALALIKQLGPPIGLWINTDKCEIFCRGGSCQKIFLQI